MKKILLLFSAVFAFCLTGVAQSDDCTGVVPTLTESATCTPVNYNIQGTFTQYFVDAGPCGADFRDGFFQFTATTTVTNIDITDNAGGGNAGLMVLSGTCAGGFTIEGCSETGNNADESVTIATVPGQVYFVVIFRSNNATTNNMTGTVCVYDGEVSSTASDCNDYIDVCSDAGFQVQPNGVGSVNEFPPGSVGGTSNPAYGGLFEPNSPWGGTNNLGCLRSGERNSTWMVVNIAVGGTLEFTFGGGGAQAGFFDWIMFPYNATTCADIISNSIAPIRCNWNGSSTGGTGLAASTPPGGSASNYEIPINTVAGEQYIICLSNYSNSTTNVPLAFGGTADISCTPLGVDFLDFEISGDCNNHMANFGWQTENEISHHYFEVLKSEDGFNWRGIGNVYNPTSSDNGKNNYEFVDESFTETSYYKLNQVDTDGKETATEIKRVVCVNTLRLNSLSPNPANNETVLTFMTKSEGSLTIMDQTGRVMTRMILNDTKGKITNKAIDVSQFDNGTYLFVIETDGERHVERFIK